MTSALEDIKTIDLEEWLTLNTASAATKIKQGQTPDMKNCWVDEKPGSVITAPGFIKVGQTPSGNPSSFCINYFKTSSGTQTFVVSDNATVWTTLDFQTFTPIITGLSSAFQLRGLVVRDKLWLTNGSDAVRTFDGTTVVVLDGTGGTPNVPKGRYISYHDERVWMYHVPSARSQAAFSALTDSSAAIIAPDNASAWPSSNTLQISEGDADFGTGLLLYNGYMHFFKQYSIWRLVGYDEYTYSRVKTRASTGTRFAESLQVLDSLIHLIGIDGIYIFDGDTTVRISDIIDPATASQTAFGFNQLQQPNTNNQFWEVTTTADWNAGTVPTNVSINNELDFVATDTSQTDFAAGVTQTNVDTATNPGSLQLALVSSGPSGANVSQGKSATFDDGLGKPRIGIASYITDGNFVNKVGILSIGSGNFAFWSVDLGIPVFVGSAIVKSFYLETISGAPSVAGVKIQYSTDNVNWSDAGSFSLPSVVFHSGVGGVLYSHSSGTSWQTVGPSDLSVSFSSITARYWRLRADVGACAVTITDLQIFQAGFQSTGTFTSKTLDYGVAPNSFGNFNADEVLNAGTTTYYTQSSSDGSSWDAAVAVVNGSAIGSALRRYLRWRVDLTNGGGGATSPVIAAVYLGAQYISVIHNTGGSIFAWGPFEAERNTLGQTINFYYRGATTSAGVSALAWNLIVPGGILNLSVLMQYVQFKIEILGGTATSLPSVTSVTINWVSGTGTQQQTLQNVASAYWRNRYWLAAAGPGATANNTIIIRGKKTFNSPWMLKDWAMASFTRFQDSLYGCSSLNGSIYRLDTGYSKAGAAMDSYFETGDFVFGGFTANFLELDVEVERIGSWSLSVGWSVDGGNTWTESLVPLTISAFDSNYIKRVNMNVTTTRIRFRFRTSGIDTPFEVHRCIVFYKLETARGSIRGDYRT